MAGLTDMEELLGRVTRPDIKNYLREAFVCYGAGAYRACIVLTANALFEDLRQKTKAVSCSTNLHITRSRGSSSKREILSWMSA